MLSRFVICPTCKQRVFPKMTKHPSKNAGKWYYGDACAFIKWVETVRAPRETLAVRPDSANCPFFLLPTFLFLDLPPYVNLGLVSKQWYNCLLSEYKSLDFVGQVWWKKTVERITGEQHHSSDIDAKRAFTMLRRFHKKSRQAAMELLCGTLGTDVKAWYQEGPWIIVIPKQWWFSWDKFTVKDGPDGKPNPLNPDFVNLLLPLREPCRFLLKLEYEKPQKRKRKLLVTTVRTYGYKVAESPISSYIHGTRRHIPE